MLYIAGQTLEKKPIYVLMWTMVQDTVIIARAQPLALHCCACVLHFAPTYQRATKAGNTILQQVTEGEASHCFVIGCHCVSERTWLL